MHLSIYGREDAFHELSTREMHPLYLWKVECISWTVNSWDASLYIWKGGCISWTVNSWDASLYLWKVECISWTVNSWDASSLFMEGRMHFMNCQLVRCILSIYGREDAFHELSTREMHPLYLWKVECISWINSWDASLYLREVECISWTVNSWVCILSILWKWGCISWTVNSWDASSLFMEGRMHFMNCQLVRCISLFMEGRMHFMNCQLVRWSLYLWKGGCISWTVYSWDASSLFMEGRMHFMNCQLVRCISLYMEGRMHFMNCQLVRCISLFMEGRMHFMNCQLVRCILSIYGRENAFHELSTREMHPLYLWKGGCISWTVNSWDASSLFMEGRMHFMNQLVRCISLFKGGRMHFMNQLVRCISLFMEVRMHFMNCQLVRCILFIYGR